MKFRAFLIYAGTGCSCCNDQNHYRGPYRTKDDAERRMTYYLAPDSKYWPLASQFAKRGCYCVEEIEVEQLPDGRVIICRDKVRDYFDFVTVNEDGTIPEHEDEYFCSEWEIDIEPV